MSELTKAVAIQQPQTPSPLAMILEAVKDKDPAYLREVLNVRREWMADEAAAAFNRAICEFQRECKIVAKLDSANGNNYATMDRIWRAIRPLMDKCGLSISWENTHADNGICKLDGHLRHSQGHAQPIHFETPIPAAVKSRLGVEVQNAAQVMGVAVTYAKRYGTCAVLGVQTGEDSDGVVAPEVERPKFTMPKPADSKINI